MHGKGLGNLHCRTWSTLEGILPGPPLFTHQVDDREYCLFEPLPRAD